MKLCPLLMVESSFLPSGLECSVPVSRAYWRGYLKFCFVSCPVSLYPATSPAERLSFRKVNRQTGHRLKHKLVDSVSGEAVDSSNKARGYEVGDNQFLLVEDWDIERARSERPQPGAIGFAEPAGSQPAAPTGRHESEEEIGHPASDYNEDEEIVAISRPQNTRTVAIERFLPSGSIDPRYFDKPYYVAPREEIGQESFAVIRDAMVREGVIGLARVVLSSRERPFLVEPMGLGLRGVTLRFAHEIRSEQDYFGDIPQMKLPTDMMKLAQHIIRSKVGEFDPSMLEDHYHTALVRILKQKHKRQVVARPAPVKPSRENIVSLMDALRQSISTERVGKPAARRALRKRAPKRSARHRKAG